MAVYDPAPGMPGLLPHRWPGAPIEGVLVDRPNRFVTLCRVGRRILRAHVPDRGRCLDLLVPGQRVVLVEARGMLRTTAWTLLLAEARSAPGVLVSLDPAGAPRLVARALELGKLPSFGGRLPLGREVLARHRALAGRIDLLLSGDMLCEVKSVGAARAGVALFPDAPTSRGVRHLRLLAGLARQGRPAGLVFCAQRADAAAVAADVAIDPEFARALRRARAAGVQVAGLRCSAYPEGMRIDGEIPVLG